MQHYPERLEVQCGLLESCLSHLLQGFWKELHLDSWNTDDALTLRWLCLKTNKIWHELGHDVAQCCGRVSYGFQHRRWMRMEMVGCKVKIWAQDELWDENGCENEVQVLKQDWEQRWSCDGQQEGKNDGEQALLMWWYWYKVVVNYKCKRAIEKKPNNLKIDARGMKV